MAKAPSGKTPAPEQAPTHKESPGQSKKDSPGSAVPAIVSMAKRLMSAGLQHRGNEATVVRGFIEAHGAGYFDETLPWLGPNDTIAKEFAFKFGRADVVVFHQDGSATVIEAKDGIKGYNHVVAGIGQCALYATQLAAKGTTKKVRRALMWTSTGSLQCDAAIADACEAAGVIAMPYPSAEYLTAIRAAAGDYLSNREVVHGCA